MLLPGTRFSSLQFPEAAKPPQTHLRCRIPLFQLKASWASWKVGRASLQLQRLPGPTRSCVKLPLEQQRNCWLHPAAPELCRNNSQRNIQPTAAPLRSPQTGITSFSFSSWLENRPSERAWIHPSIYSIKFHFFAIWKKNFHMAMPSSLLSTAPAVFPGNGGEIKPSKLCSGMPTWIKPNRPKCFLSVFHIP